ncbi:MAG: polysaccharide deacetylase [Sphingomonadaceae bacterium]|uniref:polysaccharide deacetylase n=1 Tax=Thermaurantiacus sp. TaxID=2820283 RepID=UPI00298F3805|nr:polysaccharide deacetylase [Thermaurantiacus sp.]MCS6987583.1 polysaccharide deacetylase [Sphingomonadaceae bacterium]MDW8415184.1 polysaccharide deacetylase [Thermaurantiacus sp.]
MSWPYVPLPDRPRLQWPGGARVALILTLNLETWDLVKDTDRPYYAGGPPILPDPLPGRVPDYPNYTWREYGQRVGVWRLFRLFDEMGVRASCTANAATFEHRPQMTQAALARGWEILAHNREQGELLTDFHGEPERERAVIRATLATYERHVGRPAAGWLSSSLRSTLETGRILAEAGVRFWCDLMNDDQPWPLDTPAGPLCIVPYSNEINDFTLVVRRGHGPAEMRDILLGELEALYAEGAVHARIMNVGLHPHVSGRAYRIQALREFLAFAKSLPGVWWPTREELARWYMESDEAAAHRAALRQAAPERKEAA